jgi:hypothetical protein
MTAAPLTNAEILALRELQARKRAELEQLERRPRAQDPPGHRIPPPRADDPGSAGRDSPPGGACGQPVQNRASGQQLHPKSMPGALPEASTKQPSTKPTGGRKRTASTRWLFRRVLESYAKNHALQAGQTVTVYPGTITLASVMGVAQDTVTVLHREVDVEVKRVPLANDRRRRANHYTWTVGTSREGWYVANLRRARDMLAAFPDEIGEVARAVFMSLALGSGYRTHAEIAREIDGAERSVRRSVAELEANGLVSSLRGYWPSESGHKSGKRAASRFALRFLDGWCEVTPIIQGDELVRDGQLVLRRDQPAQNRVRNEARASSLLGADAPSKAHPQQETRLSAEDGESQDVTECPAPAEPEQAHRSKTGFATGPKPGSLPVQNRAEESSRKGQYGRGSSAEDRSAAAPAAPIETPRTRRARVISDCLYAIGLEHLSDAKSVRRLLAVAGRYHPKQPVERLVGAIATAWAEGDWQGVCARMSGEPPPAPLAVDQIIRHLRAARPDGSPWRAWDVVGGLIDQGDPTAMELLPMLAEATRETFAGQGNARKQLVIATQLIGARAADTEVLEVARSQAPALGVDPVDLARYTLEPFARAA